MYRRQGIELLFLLQHLYRQIRAKGCLDGTLKNGFQMQSPLSLTKLASCGGSFTETLSKRAVVGHRSYICYQLFSISCLVTFLDLSFPFFLFFPSAMLVWAVSSTTLQDCWNVCSQILKESPKLVPITSHEHDKRHSGWQINLTMLILVWTTLKSRLFILLY